MVKIKRALISVSDKRNVVELAKILQLANIEIISTGGTAKLLIENEIPVMKHMILVAQMPGSIYNY